MNSSKPAALGFSFEGFAERGGRTGEHKDGWGIAFHSSAGCTLVADHLAAIDSPLAASLRDNPVKAKIIVAHIRKATHGRIGLENSHPFTRQLWGKTWSFAHNGDLKTWQAPVDATEGTTDEASYAASGDTDSERAFCHLLAGLLKRYPNGQPSRTAVFDVLRELSGAIATHGTFNFLLSDGDTLYAHCSTHLHYVMREYPFSVAKLIDCERSIDFSQHNHLDDRIAVIATHPLTSNEQWLAFGAGELKMFVGGEAVLAQAATPPRWLVC